MEAIDCHLRLVIGYKLRKRSKIVNVTLTISVCLRNFIDWFLANFNGLKPVMHINMMLILNHCTGLQRVQCHSARIERRIMVTAQ